MMRGHAGLQWSVNVAPPPPQSALMERFHSDPTGPLADAESPWRAVWGGSDGEMVEGRAPACYWWMCVGGRGIATAAASSAWLHLRP